MEGWQSKPIGEVFRVVNGGTPKTRTPAYWDGAHQWITPAEMGGLPSPYLAASRRTLTDEGLRVGAELVPPQSIIISSRAPIGHLVINEVPMAFNQGCKGLVPSPAIDTKFAYYFLLANVPLLESLGTGATFKELSGGKLKEVPFHFPPLPEQCRIVAILDEALEAIATAKANTEKNLQYARELFDSRLEAIFSTSESGWVQKRLQDVCAKITDGTHQTPKYFEQGVVFLSSRNVTSGKIDWENIKYIDMKQHAEMHKRVAPRLDDILLAKNGTTGVAAIVDRDVIFDIYVSLALIRSLGAVLPRFLLHFINSPVAKRQFNKRLKGVGVPNLHLEEIREVLINFPVSLDEQTQVLAHLDELRNQVENLRDISDRKLCALDELKKSLLHQAFTGQLTAKTADKQLAEVA